MGGTYVEHRMGPFQIVFTVGFLGLGGVRAQIIEAADNNRGCEGAVTLHLADSTVVYKSSEINDTGVTNLNIKYEEVTMTGSCCFLLYQSPRARGKTHRLNSPVHKERKQLRKVGAVKTTACLRRGGAPIVPIVCGVVAIVLILIAAVLIKKKCFKKKHKPVPTEEDVKTETDS